VATRKDTVRVGGDSAEIKGNNKHITVKTDGEITSDCPENDREINMVGGFLTTPLRIRLEKGRRRDIRIRVSDKN